MNIILGFGKTEEDFEQQEFDFCEKFIKEKSNKNDLMFTDELVEELNMLLERRKKELDVLSEKYKDAKEYPDRYSTYYFTILHDLHNMCVVFKFTHINRRHAMSPDGWASLWTKKVYYADVWDFRE